MLMCTVCKIIEFGIVVMFDLLFCMLICVGLVLFVLCMLYDLFTMFAFLFCFNCLGALKSTWFTQPPAEPMLLVFGVMGLCLFHLLLLCF